MTCDGSDAEEEGPLLAEGGVEVVERLLADQVGRVFAFVDLSRSVWMQAASAS